jgi:hypothetical protein
VHNPYDQNLTIFFAKLNAMFGSFQLLCNQLNSFDNWYSQSLLKNGISPDLIRAGSCLLMQDVTEKPQSLCRNKYCVGKFEIKGDEYFKHLNDVKLREASWCISQAFEAFERFLNNTVILTHKLKPDCVTEKKKKKFEEKCKINSKDKKNYFVNFTNFTYRSNIKKINFLKKFSTTFKQNLDNNYSLRNFNDWFTFFSEIRHAIVHNEMVIKFNKFKWEKINPRFMDKYFPGNLSENGYLLHFESKHVRLNLESLLEFSFLIYKSVSYEFNYDIIGLK